MACPAPTRVCVEELRPDGKVPIRCARTTQHDGSFRLPILARSVALLRPLLRDSIIDLELTSSVIALDPGLTYGTLQLANQDIPDEQDRIWQLPLAVVAAGGAALEGLLEKSAAVSYQTRAASSRLRQLLEDAIVRACVAEVLARELGSCPQRKLFLSGLLFELPSLATFGLPAMNCSSTRLLADMCHSLPAATVRASLAGREQEAPTDPAVSIVLLANAVTHLVRSSGPEVWLEEVAGRPLWKPWEEIPRLQRLHILRRTHAAGIWAAINWSITEPWAFMDRLEHSNDWE